MTKTPLIPIIERARERAGSARKLAEALGLQSHAPLYRWRIVPIKYVVALAAVAGVRPRQVRPDLPKELFGE